MSIPIGTFGDLRRVQVFHLDIYCVEARCQHHASLPIERFDDDEVIAVVSRRFVCSRCGSRSVDVRPSMTDRYADMHRRGIKTGSL